MQHIVRKILLLTTKKTVHLCRKHNYYVSYGASGVARLKAIVCSRGLLIQSSSQFKYFDVFCWHDHRHTYTNTSTSRIVENSTVNWRKPNVPNIFSFLCCLLFMFRFLLCMRSQRIRQNKILSVHRMRQVQSTVNKFVRKPYIHMFACVWRRPRRQRCSTNTNVLRTVQVIKYICLCA